MSAKTKDRLILNFFSKKPKHTDFDTSESEIHSDTHFFYHKGMPYSHKT